MEMMKRQQLFRIIDEDGNSVGIFYFPSHFGEEKIASLYKEFKAWQKEKVEEDFYFEDWLGLERPYIECWREFVVEVNI